jgi:hypothetical protein
MQSLQIDKQCKYFKNFLTSIIEHIKACKGIELIVKKQHVSKLNYSAELIQVLIEM